MKKYAIVRLEDDTIKKGYNAIGVYLGENNYMVCNVNGDNAAILNLPDVKTKSVRLPAEARKSLTQMAKEHEKVEELKLQIAELQLKVRDTKVAIELSKREYKKARGFLSVTEFAEEVFKNLPVKMRNAIKKDGWIFETPTGIGYTLDRFYISRMVEIQKWVKENSFIYREYDGQLFTTDDCENDKCYKATLAKYRRLLPTKGEITDCLDIADKATLYYTACYSVPYNRTELTAEYAKEIAKKLSE